MKIREMAEPASASSRILEAYKRQGHAALRAQTDFIDTTASTQTASARRSSWAYRLPCSGHAAPRLVGHAQAAEAQVHHGHPQQDFEEEDPCGAAQAQARGAGFSQRKLRGHCLGWCHVGFRRQRCWQRLVHIPAHAIPSPRRGISRCTCRASAALRTAFLSVQNTLGCVEPVSRRSSCRAPWLPAFAVARQHKQKSAADGVWGIK